MTYFMAPNVMVIFLMGLRTQKFTGSLEVPDLLYDPKGKGNLCGWFDLGSDRKRHGFIKCRLYLLYDPKGHGDLCGRFDLVYDP